MERLIPADNRDVIAPTFTIWYRENDIRRIYKEFKNPENIWIDAFLGADREILVTISMSLSHYDGLSK